MTFSKTNHNQFNQLKNEIEGHPRLAGYYLMEIVSIDGFPDDDVERDKMLDEVFQFIDDQDWLPADQRPQDQTWNEYETTEQIAKKHFIESLQGGNEIGHTNHTIAPMKALEFWDTFVTCFSSPKHYYIGMGLGDPSYVFQNGVTIADHRFIGVITVVEDD